MEIASASPGDLIKDSDTARFTDDVINASRDVPVIVDFWAPWCGPCKQLGPSIEKIVTEAAGSVKLVKINIDENPQVPSKYGVRGIPTLLIFQNGQVIAQKVGAVPKSQLLEWIKESI